MNEYLYANMETKPFYSAIVHNDSRHAVFNLRVTGYARIKIAIDEKMQQWSAKQLHAHHANNLNQDHIPYIPYVCTYSIVYCPH